MSPMQQRFELWAGRSEWATLMSNEKDSNGDYLDPTTRLAFDTWMAAQADAINLIAESAQEVA